MNAFHSLSEQGFSLIEVMVAMVILAFSILGVTAMFQWAEGGVQTGWQGGHALALAQARLEAKQASPWSSLLMDDLDSDGVPESAMVDDGTQEDQYAGDGVYTGRMEQDGVVIVWTIGHVRHGQLVAVPTVTIEVRAGYRVGHHDRTVRMGTIRANPLYTGD